MARKAKSRFRFTHFIFALSLGSVAGAAVLLWFIYGFFSAEFPDVSVLRSQYPVVRYQGAKKPAKISLQRVRPEAWVGIKEVSRAAVGAVVVSEDWAFYQHKGYDANQIREAFEEDLRELKFARGASTITQQVIKNVFLEADKNLWRKVKELVLAVRIEQSVGKARILETYLNIAEWGEGIFGIGAAAHHYFSKAPAELTAREGAFLAMLLPSPKRYSQSFRRRELTSYARGTVNSILGKMNQASYISDEEYAEQLASRLSFEGMVDPSTSNDSP